MMRRRTPLLLSLGLLAGACGPQDETAMDEHDSAPDEALAETEAAVSGISGNYPGYVAYNTTDTVNRCAGNPVSDTSNLRKDPSWILAYKSGKSSCGVAAPTEHNGNRPMNGDMIHRQGIQRMVRNGKNYLLVSNSVKKNQAYAGFEVVELGTQGGTGYTLYSGGATPSSSPSCNDRIVGYKGYPYHSRNHAGGIQVWGRYVIVPLEDEDDGRTAGFRIADLYAPNTPWWSQTIFRKRGQRKNAGAASLTRLSDGRFLALIFGHDSNDVEVFVTTGTSMCMSRSCWVSKAKANTPSGFEPYQNVQIVNRCNGALYAVGTHKNGSKDWVDTWRLKLNSSTLQPTFTKVANRNLTCKSANTGNTHYCNFHAGAGVYVNPSGRLYMYGVEHYDDAHPGNGYGVKVREFNQQ